MDRQNLFDRIKGAMISGQPIDERRIRSRFFRRDSYTTYRQTIDALIGIGAIKRIGTGRRGDPFMLVFLEPGADAIKCPTCKGTGIVSNQSAHIPPPEQPAIDEPPSVEF